MNGNLIKKAGLVATAIVGLGLVAAQASDMREDVNDAIGILSLKQNSETPIPLRVLKQAKAVGIIEVTKGAFGVGGAAGEGVIVVRSGHGWSAPIAFSQGGGSVGFQVGVDIKKYIYVFNTDQAWRNFTNREEVRFQAAATATAGPDSYTAEGASGLPEASLYYYTLSEGAFAGAAIGGQSVGNARETNEDLYGTWLPDQIISPKTPRPAYAKPLYDLLNLSSK